MTEMGFSELIDGFKDGFAKDATDNVERLTGHPASTPGLHTSTRC